jgi:hypothetical protein
MDASTVQFIDNALGMVVGVCGIGIAACLIHRVVAYINRRDDPRFAKRAANDP